MRAADETELLEEWIRETPAEHLGERIRAARKLAGLSHDRLAARVGTSRFHLTKLERGLHRPRVPMLTAIAEATGRELADFLTPSSSTNGRTQEEAPQ